MSFDPSADPKAVVARAAELAIEQMDRLVAAQKAAPDNVKNRVGIAFYSQPFEVQTSNNIAKLLAGYAVLEGLVPEDRIPRS